MLELYDIERLEGQIYNIKSLVNWARYIYHKDVKEAFESLKQAVENLKIIEEDIEKCKEKNL